ncbi:Stf0 family sulfotransferase [Agrobacterium leguminum]|uniref:Sulphotransferase Stf0 domain-containing protein n=1 Tax=Agrobacterium deltaense NCPPB 1641 TaxID=1183425 RepID=A0A1S7TSM1_9HYPH|nr:MULTISPECIES: Stf0 family sulfotransferase [Agrobacterium]WFS69319.1 Stf0 family sulfotransferase [Agrobacterium leguminum]CVI57330.1 hypothetical protein AGR7A_Lc10025 [Agrobacterium deltaense NCPPB 1641]
MQGYSSLRFDLPLQTIERVLVVASSYRCGSTYLSSLLWADGRFGAPFEYFNFEKHMIVLMARLGAVDAESYLRELIKRRTAPNGTFGIKCHFHHFEAMVQQSEWWMGQHRSARYLYVNRLDKIAQAVSMAKALQTNSWVSFEVARKVPLFYSHDLIRDCLQEVMTQTSAWWKWFERNGITPFTVNYEDLQDRPTDIIAGIANWFGVSSQPLNPIEVPMPAIQSDATNLEWQNRFISESRMSPSTNRQERA